MELEYQRYERLVAQGARLAIRITTSSAPTILAQKEQLDAKVNEARQIYQTLAGSARAGRHGAQDR